MRKIGLLVLGIIVLLGIVSAQNTAIYTNYQNRPGFSSYYSNGLYNPWPGLGDSESCYARQDILLQVAPGSCQPAVVRSDLLAEQNVPVFCQIEAIKLNPLIDIQQINNIRFTGEYPKDVVNAGFHPAQAALRSGRTLEGSPVMNNIGYAVVVLRQNPNEKELPDSVTVNLTGVIEYDSGNAFGIGKSEFRLSEQTDEEFKMAQDTQSFWNGRFSIKVNNLNAESVSITLYDGDRKITTTTVEKGKGSSKIYVPGAFCQAALVIYYDGFEAEKKKARIEVDGDVMDVYEGSRILNNKCVVGKINPDAGTGTGSVSVSCGSTRMELSRIARGSGDTTLGDETLADLEAEEAFNDAIASYEKVALDYPAEREAGAEGANYYGETALQNALKLVDSVTSVNKDATKARILNELITQYPKSLNRAGYESRLRNLYLVDESLSGSVVYADNRYRTIRVLSVSDLSRSSSAKFAVSGVREIPELHEGEITNSDSSKPLTDDLYRIQLDKIIDSNSVEATITCKSGSAKHTFTQGDRFTCPGGKSYVSLSDVNFNAVAKLRVVPDAERTRTEANLTISVGIEKRAIELSPDKTKQKLESLNKTIEKWDSISNNLGSAVKGLKAACFATSAVLTVKNLVGGLDGSALARRQSMEGVNGWKKRCEDAIATGRIVRSDGKSANVDYRTATECFNKEKDFIEKEVSARTEAIKNVNSIAETAQQKAGVESKGGVVTYDSAYTEAFYDGLQDKYGDLGVQAPENGRAAYSPSELRDLAYNLELKKQGYVFGAQEADRIADRIKLNEDTIAQIDKSRAANGLGVYKVPLGASAGLASKEAPFLEVNGANVNGIPVSGGSLGEATNAVLVQDSIGVTYLVAGTKRGTNELDPSQIYEYREIEGNGKVTGIALSPVNNKDYLDASGNVDIGKFTTLNKVGSFREMLDVNEIREADRVVRYFEVGPDKGMPATVPFNFVSGWYAVAISSGGQQKAYASSGLPVNWRICNVGSDGTIDSGDECQTVSDGYLGPILGRSNEESRKLMQDSRRALLDAASQKGNKVVSILGKNVYQGPPVSPFEAVQCQDFMSPDDCLLMFNVCDPVICPASRCDLGGNYPVADVVQTGVVGSALLCLPNYREGIAVPVCLTGIQAGIDGYVSILKAHQQCLQENLATGRTVGICDEITSVYTCDFFWRQVAPAAAQLLPKILEGSFENSARGGGEYLNAKGAWDNADASVNYFTNYYASNSLEAFKIRSVEDAGTEICRAFISVSVPTSFDGLVEPDSPPQFHATFSSVPFSDVTIPATSQYKVFYHIYAGKSQGVYYTVYLKDPGESGYYSAPNTVFVASNYISPGNFNTETKDFTAPTGYRQLCIQYNGKEECGFTEVSSSFLVNQLADNYASEQATAGAVTEQECISGSPNAGALLNPNVQQGISETVNPDNFNRGIVRICASRNPGLGTEPSRFVDVGYCGDQAMRCWLDKTSVQNAISDSNKGVLNQTLREAEEIDRQNLESEGFIVSGDIAGTISSFAQKITDLENALFSRNLSVSVVQQQKQSVETEIDSAVGSDNERLYLNSDKAAVSLQRSRLTGIVAQAYLRVQSVFVPAGPTTLTENVSDEDKVVSSGSQDVGASDEKVTYSLQAQTIKASSGDKDVMFLVIGSKTPIYFVLDSVNSKSGKIYALASSGADTLIGTYRTDGNIIIGTGLQRPGTVEQSVWNNFLLLDGTKYFDLTSGNVGADTDSAKEEIKLSENYDPNTRVDVLVDEVESGVYLLNGKVYSSGKGIGFVIAEELDADYIYYTIRLTESSDLNIDGKVIYCDGLISVDEYTVLPDSSKTPKDNESTGQAVCVR